MANNNNACDGALVLCDTCDDDQVWAVRTVVPNYRKPEVRTDELYCTACWQKELQRLSDAGVNDKGLQALNSLCITRRRDYMRNVNAN